MKDYEEIYTFLQVNNGKINFKVLGLDFPKTFIETSEKIAIS
ncbi:hypothetical protein [Sulfolobus sp. E11-6]|nr:hypothetical protein [Sulfolobus sp. E11-6]